MKRCSGSKQQIVSEHMNALLNINAVSSDSNLKALRQLHDNVKVQVRGLKSLGVASGSHGSLLSPILMSKLPPEIRLIISRVVGDGDWELDKLLETLEKVVRARERAATSDTMPSRKTGKLPSTAAALLTGGPELAPTVISLTCPTCVRM